MTSLNLCVPASGARVTPAFLTSPKAWARLAEKVIPTLNEYLSVYRDLWSKEIESSASYGAAPAHYAKEYIEPALRATGLNLTIRIIDERLPCFEILDHSGPTIALIAANFLIPTFLSSLILFSSIPPIATTGILSRRFISPNTLNPTTL